jgi:hypothetical protein
MDSPEGTGGLLKYSQAFTDLPSAMKLLPQPGTLLGRFGKKNLTRKFQSYQGSADQFETEELESALKDPIRRKAVIWIFPGKYFLNCMRSTNGLRLGGSVRQVFRSPHRPQKHP